MDCAILRLPTVFVYRLPKFCCIAIAIWNIFPTDFAARAGITGRHESGALFIGSDDKRYGGRAVGTLVLVVVAKYGVIGRQDCPAGVAEYRVDAFIGQDLHDHIGTVHTRAREWMPAGFRVCRLVSHCAASHYVSTGFFASVY